MGCAIVAALIATIAFSARAAGACDASEHRQFDFWLGEWNVRTPDGKLAGANSIKSEYGGCVLHERYSTSRGYSGESLNVYDAPQADGTVRQHWQSSEGDGEWSTAFDGTYQRK